MSIIHNMHFSILLILGILIFNKSSYGAGDLSLEDKLVNENKEISSYIDNFANQLDYLLSNRRSRIKNYTNIKLIGFIDSREGDVLNEKGHIDINLRLPRLEEKWKLLVASYDTEDEFEGLNRNRDGASPRAQKLGTAVSYSQTFKNIKTVFRPRIDLKNPLATSFLLKFNSDFKIPIFKVYWQKKFFLHSVDGAGESISFDFDKPLTNNLLFRIFNEAQYLDKSNFFNVAQGPTFLYKISDTIALSNTLTINSQNRNFMNNDGTNFYTAANYHLESYAYIVSYSHSLYKNVLHYQISPSLSFQKQRNFKGYAGAVFKAEFIF
jgi:hypothetical protein